MISVRRFVGVSVLGLLLFAGCGAQRAFRQGRALAQAEDWDQAVYYLSKALSMEPGNIEYRKALDIAKVKASQYHLELAKSYGAAGALDLAIVEYRVAAMLDPTNRYVSDSLENSIDRRRELAASEAAQETEIERAKRETAYSTGTPILNPREDTPLTLNFPPNTKVKEIYTALGKAAGINVLFDSGIRDQETFSIDIANVSFRKALDLVAIGNRHFYKAIDDSTIMVIPDNPQKRRDFEDHVVKTFYLSNAAPNDVVNTLRGLLDARRIATNQALNAITIRDTPAKITVMERIIEANDKPPSEVVIDVEILEVRKSQSLNYGAGLSSYSVTQTLEQSDTVNGLTGLRVSSIPFINASDWLLTVPNINYRLERNRGNIRTLARPSLRALDGKQVTLRLGDQVPIETSTFSAVGGGTVPLTRNFQFRDIGTNVDITPRVHHNNEVTLQLQVEVTSVGEDPDGSAGPTPPTFGNRRINTEIRLKDGETNLLAGLFTSSEEQSRSGLPILSDIPILGHIFTQNSKSKSETDIILTLTPHIVRTPNIRRRDMEPFYVGTATNVGGVTAVSEQSALGGSPFTDDAGSDGAVVEPEDSGSNDDGSQSGGRPPRVSPRPRATPPRSGINPSEGEQGRLETDPGQPSPTSVRLPASLSAGGGLPNLPNEIPSPAATPVPIPQVAPATVSLAPASAAVGVGDTVTVSIQITGASGVGHAPMWLTYDRRVVEALGASEGGFLAGEDGAATQFLSNIQPDEGRIILGLSRVGHGTGVNGSGTLAVVQFRAIAAGTSSLVFESASVRDSASRTLPASFVPGSVTVQ